METDAECNSVDETQGSSPSQRNNEGWDCLHKEDTFPLHRAKKCHCHVFGATLLVKWVLGE